MSQPRRHADGAGSVYTANDKPCNHILHFLSPEFKHGRVQHIPTVTQDGGIVSYDINLDLSITLRYPDITFEGSKCL